MVEWLSRLPEGPPIIRLASFVWEYQQHNNRVEKRQATDGLILIDEEFRQPSTTRVILSDAYQTLMNRMKQKGVKL